MPDTLFLGLIGMLLLSPLLLRVFGERVFDSKSFMLSLVGGTMVALLPFAGIGNPEFVWQMLFAQTFLFVSFVSVSRVRQRKSAFLLALASVASNGSWFLTMYVLAEAYTKTHDIMRGSALSLEFAAFFAIIIAGTLCGRLVGVQWMRFVEMRFGVTSDAVASSGLKKLDAKTVPTLMWLLALTAICLPLLGLAPLRDVLVVCVLGFLQNGIYTLNSRLANRNHPGWPVVTKLFASVIFIVHWTYLLRYSAAGGMMPLALLIPYTVSTVAGSNIGAMMSIIFEKWLGLKPDDHVKKEKDYAHVKWHRTLLSATFLVVVAYLAANEAVLAALGITPSRVALPFPIFEGMPFERTVALIFGGAVFFTNEAMHNLMSRAGNRDNAVYHAILCVLLGFTVFWTGSFTILNARFIDLIPLAAFGGAAGQLAAQKFSMWIEVKLNSVMDVPPEPKKVSA